MLLLEIASFLVMSAAAPGAVPLQIAMQGLDGRPILRIPARPASRSRRREAANSVLREEPATACRRALRVVSARFSQPGSVDLVMRSRRVYRAALAPDCPPLGYYSSLYLAPGNDGQLCAGRDSIVSRDGGECPITGFTRLVREPAR